MMFRNADRTKAVLRTIGTGEISGRELRSRVVGDVWWRRPWFAAYLMELEDRGLVVGRTVGRHVAGIGDVTERRFRLSDAGLALIVGEDFQIQQGRVRSLQQVAREIGPSGQSLVLLTEAVLKEADEAAISGDLPRILCAYQTMKEMNE